MVLNNLDLTSDSLFSNNRLFSISRFHNNGTQNHLLNDDIAYSIYNKPSHFSEKEYGVYCFKCGNKIKRYNSVDSYIFSLLGEKDFSNEFHELCQNCDDEISSKVVVGGKKVDINSFLALLYVSNKKDTLLIQNAINDDFPNVKLKSLKSESDMWTDERREYVSFALKNGVDIW